MTFDFFSNLANFGFISYGVFNIDNLLLILYLLPLIACFHLSVNSLETLKKLGLFYGLIIFNVSLLLFTYNLQEVVSFKFEFFKIMGYTLTYDIILDKISIWFIVLSTFLIPLVILVSWKSVSLKFIRQFLVLLFLIEFFLINVFSIGNVLFFYLFFEATLIPMFLFIGILGSRRQRISAAYQFFLYTFIGSFFMLLSIIILFISIGDLSYFELVKWAPFLDLDLQKFLWFAFFVTFAVKLPMVPFHLWLPEAHVEASTAGSVLLAGILLKLGGYGMFRFLLPLFPEASYFFIPVVYILAIAGIIYTSILTMCQVDLKKIVAYSSVSHMGFVLIGLFTDNLFGVVGALYICFSHAFISSGLFILIGVLYDRYKTRLVYYYGNIVQFMPLCAILAFLLVMGNLGFPGTANFVGELLVGFSVFLKNSLAAVLCLVGTIFGAFYNILFYLRVFFNYTGNYLTYSDVSFREFFILSFLNFFNFFFGIKPIVLVDLFENLQ